MHPFEYPATKHKRRLSPGPYVNPRSFKPHLREEFNRQCVYCRMPDGMKTEAGFAVEHYRPKSLFRRLRTHYPNLFYACSVCNSMKGSFWPEPWFFSRGNFIPNPCDHVMSDHLRYVGPRVDPRSLTGAFAREYLDLDYDEVAEYRATLIRTIAAVYKDRRADRALARTVARKLSKERSPALRSRLAAALAEINAEIAAATSDLERLTGDPNF